MGCDYIFVIVQRVCCATPLKRLWGISYSMRTMPPAYAMSLGSDAA
jgi:hypothetical protein